MSQDECYSQSFIFIPDSQVHAICMSQCRRTRERFKTSFVQVIHVFIYRCIASFYFNLHVHVHVKIITFSAHLKFLECFSQCLDSLQVKMVSGLIKDEEIWPRENQAVPWMNQCII